jgi:hypothetical protein
MARPVFDVLSQIRGGAAINDAAKDLNECVRAVLETGKPGSITIKLTVEPDKTDNTVVTIQPDVTLKLPKKARAKGIFYVDSRTGDLSREDPRQLEMQMEREATLREQGATALSAVGRGTG